MKQLVQAGRLLYSIGIVALGVHQLIIKDLRPEVFPPLPAWPHQYSVFAICTGIALIFAGIIISGLFTIKSISAKRVCLYLGACFLILFLTCHLPYILIYGPYKASRLDVWFSACEALAYSGGAFVMAGSFPGNDGSFLAKLIPCGRIFYAVLIILFGYSHFVFTAFIATMVPQFMGAQMLWTYFTGATLIGAGIAIILRIWVKPVALLLAGMLFLFFIFFHVPDAIANPKTEGGNEIVRAIIALLFTGIALVIAATNATKK